MTHNRVLGTDTLDEDLLCKNYCTLAVGLPGTSLALMLLHLRHQTDNTILTPFTALLPSSNKTTCHIGRNLRQPVPFSTPRGPSTRQGDRGPSDHSFVRLSLEPGQDSDRPASAQSAGFATGIPCHIAVRPRPPSKRLAGWHVARSNQPLQNAALFARTDRFC